MARQRQIRLEEGDYVILKERARHVIISDGPGPDWERKSALFSRLLEVNAGKPCRVSVAVYSVDYGSGIAVKLQELPEFIDSSLVRKIKHFPEAMQVERRLRRWNCQVEIEEVYGLYEGNTEPLQS